MLVLLAMVETRDCATDPHELGAARLQRRDKLVSASDTNVRPRHALRRTRVRRGTAVLTARRFGARFRKPCRDGCESGLARGVVRGARLQEWPPVLLEQRQLRLPARGSAIDAEL